MGPSPSTSLDKSTAFLENNSIILLSECQYKILENLAEYFVIASSLLQFTHNPIVLYAMSVYLTTMAKKKLCRSMTFSTVHHVIPYANIPLKFVLSVACPSP